MGNYSDEQWFERFGFDKGQTFDVVNPVNNASILELPIVTVDPITERLIGGVTVDKLIEYGAILEDEGDRPLRHFLDPQNSNRGITYGLQFNSADWALEDIRTTSFQRVSYQDLVSYYASSTSAKEPSARRKYMALLWQGLGHMIHHIQDMAQPQHVRNDAHCNIYEGYLKNCQRLENLTGGVWDLYQPSEYEQFSELMLTPGLISSYYSASPYFGGGRGFDFIQRGFITPRDFWLKPNEGMAEFVGKNFVSVDTNFRAINPMAPLSGLQSVEFTTHPQFPLPNGDSGIFPAVIERVTLTRENICPPDVPCEISGDFYFVKRAFRDDVTNTEYYLNRFSSFGLWDDELVKQGQAPIFSLNRLNYEDRYHVLVPRAVGFSQGLIDFFFRGKVRAVISDDKLKFKNESVYPISGTITSCSDKSSGDRDIQRSKSVNLAPGSETEALDPDDYFFENPLYTGWRSISFSGDIGGAPGVANYHFFYENEPDPQLCNSIIKANGSSEGLDRSFFLGEAPVEVGVHFEAYSIPDGLKILSGDGSVLSSTGGKKSGYHFDEFDFDPENDGGGGVRVIVDGNSDSNTAWNLKVVCPSGGPEDDERINVSIVSHQDLGVACSVDIYIDGQRRATIGRDGALVRLTPGSNHVFEYRNYRYGIGQCYFNGSWSVSYHDNAGEHPLPSPGYSSGTFFMPVQ